MVEAGAETTVPRVAGDVNTVRSIVEVDASGRAVSKLRILVLARIAYGVLALVSLERRRIVVGLSLCTALSACSPVDRRVPWGTMQMAREIVYDLRRFEHVDDEFGRVEVLGWRAVESRQKRLPPVDEIRHRSSEAVVWMRVEGRSGVPGWIVVDAWSEPPQRPSDHVRSPGGSAVRSVRCATAEPGRATLWGPEQANH